MISKLKSFWAQLKERASKISIKKPGFSPLAIVLTLWILFLLGTGSVFLYVNMVINNTNDWFGEMPGIQRLENPRTEFASELYSSDGVLLGKYFRSNRTPLSYDQISPKVKNALLATEDIRYFDHAGIDMKGTFAIIWYLIKGDNRGSSTITQQLAKNLYRTRDESLEGSLSDVPLLGKVIIKTKEWITAIRLEKSYTKEEIMKMYLNTVDFGSNSFGIAVAAETFFNKPQDSLKIEEAAVLIGLLKAPTAYSPVLNPDESRQRRNTVLSQLEKYDYLTEEESKNLQDKPLGLSYSVESHNTGLAPYFRKICSDSLRKWCNNNGYDLYADGLKVYTTLDSRFQKHAEKAVMDHMSAYQKLFFEHWEGRNPWTVEEKYGRFKEMKGFLKREIKKTERYRVLKEKHGSDTSAIFKELRKPYDMSVFSYEGTKDTVFSHMDSLKYYLHFLHTGFMSMDPGNGKIKAWVGGIDHEYFQYDHVLQGKRQPGSTFKPIVYSTIIGEAKESYGPCFKVVDAPVTFMTGDPEDPTWTPQNAGGKFSGDTMTLRQAMARSVNSITAYMMKIMGPQTPQLVLNYARSLGIKSHLEPYPVLCLGAFDVSVYELVGAYSTFINKGIYTEPYFLTRIEDRFGNVIKEFYPEQKQALSKETAYVMTYMLRGATEEEGGTGLGLHRYGLLAGNNEIGAKTGTTQNYSDAWFMGVTPQLVSGVWVGGEHRSIHFRQMDLGQGSRMAMPIWANYMQAVYADTSLNIHKQNFPRPDFDLSVTLDCQAMENDTTQKENLNPSLLSMPSGNGSEEDF